MKKTIKKIIPRRVRSELTRTRRIEADVQHLKNEMTHIKHFMEVKDNRLDVLKKLANDVEPYQPTYGIAGILNADPKRSSLDRCRAIEQYLGPVAGLSMLDIGSSLGYVCFYFADRGSNTEGWDANPKNTEVTRLISEVNGIKVDIKTKNFDKDSIETIPSGKFDAITILSVLHHVIYHQGIKYTQELMKELMKKTPILIVELAKKGEDKKLFWDKSQPKNELDIFNLIKDDVNIEEIGSFHNHLSDNKRPLYAVTLKKK